MDPRISRGGWKKWYNEFCSSCNHPGYYHMNEGGDWTFCEGWSFKVTRIEDKNCTCKTFKHSF